MKLQKIFAAIIVCLLLTVPVHAQQIMDKQAEMIGAESLYDGLPDDAQEMMQEFDPLVQTDPVDGFLRIFKKAAAESGGAIKNAVTTMLRVLLIVVLCQLVQSVGEEKGNRTVNVTGALAITACCATGVHAMVGLGRQTMNEITSFSSLLLPVMVSAATASGSLTGAGVTYTLSTVFSNLLIRFSNVVIIPAIYAYLALAVTESMAGTQRLKRLQELIGWFIENGLKIVMYLFVGSLTITGMLSATADTAALKAAKFTMSGVIPVVGGIISGAAATVLSGAALLKSAVGTFGMLAVLAVFIMPFINMGVSYLVFKISAALCGTFTDAHSVLLEGLSGVMGYLLAMTSGCALITLLSCCSLIRTVQI